ncbi:MAG: FIST C-terminal domain-containing protein [Lachnospiraceae bacterium]|nr:FIST C-terminal domain-containing protein [Lachnospiraceae bacterium]
MSRCISALSMSSDAKTAVEEVCAKIDAEVELPVAVIFFSEYDIFEDVARLIRDKYPSALSIGSSTYLNIVNDKHSRTGMSAMAIFSGVEVSFGTLEEINRHPMNYMKRITEAMEKLESTKDTICLEFTPAFLNSEELVLDTFAKALEDKDIPVVGSSSGCEFGENKAAVALNGEVYENRTVFAFIRNLEGSIKVYKENIYKPTDKFLRVTDIDCAEKRIYEFDDKPAFAAMKEILGVEDDRLMPDAIAKRPIGRIEDGEIFITDVNKIHEDGSLTYLTRVYNMTKVAILELDDVKKVWNETAKACKKLIKKPEFTLVVNCGGRCKTFEEMKLIDSFTEILSEKYGTFVTVSGFGEQLNDTHFNQTMLLIMFE